MTTSDRRVPRRKLSDTAADQLSARIEAGEYPVGSKLPAEKDLAQLFGVGRSSMREAVRTLEAAGYLESTHGVGVFVRNDKPQNVGPLDLTLGGGYTMSDLFEVRIALEGMAAELAATRLTDHHRELLVTFLTAAGDPEVTHDEFVRLDGKFHRQVAEASGNPLLLVMWETLGIQFEEYSLKVIQMPGRLDRAHADHVGIADALTQGDPALAGDRAREHVRTVQSELRRAADDAARPRATD
ncbi:FadR/GntR family transcriptional regulator [Isoptericola aurantiacus]|uniref:FadR/GntR family transcriptional regulator n=1 Tax=Isoptericola aurantiacus TaxID=3377839 RepID=UPI00383A2252